MTSLLQCYKKMIPSRFGIRTKLGEKEESKSTISLRILQIVINLKKNIIFIVYIIFIVN